MNKNLKFIDVTKYSNILKIIITITNKFYKLNI